MFEIGALGRVGDNKMAAQQERPFVPGGPVRCFEAS